MKKAPNVRPTESPKMKDAAPVSERVELDSIRLVATMARLGTFREDTPVQASINFIVQTQADKAACILHVRPRLVLVANPRDSMDEELLRIEATFLLSYRMSSFVGIRKLNIDAFGRLNGVFNIWPYWREYVQATTTRMGVPTLTVPVFRIDEAKPAPRRHPTSRVPNPRSKVKRGTRKRAAAVK